MYPTGKGVCQKVTDSTCLTTVTTTAGCGNYKIDSAKALDVKNALC